MKARLASALAAACLGLGCAMPPDPGVRSPASGGPPVPAVAEGVVFADEVFAASDGTSLYGRSHRPARGDVRGVVVFMNGLKDHGDHYAAFSQRLALRGYATYAFDLRGHGRSAGPRVAIPRFDDAVSDLAQYVERVRQREPGKPVFVFGHSLGGAVVASYAADRDPAVAGIVLSAPALAFADPAVQVAAIRTFDALAPDAPLLDPKHADFSRDPAIVRDMARDPLIHQPGGPVHTAAELLGALGRLWSHPERVRVPLLALHGTADRLTAPSGSRDLVARAGSADRTLRLYDGLFHDLLHEPEAAVVERDITAWLDAHTGGPPMPPMPPADAPAATGSLRGDVSPRATTVDLDARAERATTSGAPVAATGGLRLRQAFGSIGVLGGLDLRAGSESGFRWEADAHALGLGARLGHTQLGVTAGVGAHHLAGVTGAVLPAELSADVSLGAVRMLARGGVVVRLDHGGPTTSALGIADEVRGLLGVRLGRDARYWADVSAGAGPFLAVTADRRGDATLWGIALGLDLWGAN